MVAYPQHVFKFAVLVEMPVTNFDASLLTANRRAQAVYTNQAAVQTLQNAGTKTPRSYTFANNSAEVVISKNIGACVCTQPKANKNSCGCGGNGGF